ncbi:MULTISPECIES: hypothetical protein [unclassified Streptomyces]|uniref:hypothetical protein n=1 Tax=unclassified Streptomyces TaxID=2593676 RepID=UPI00278C6805|nr:MULTISPECIES: hypothetical protein [unclassified Streptomyces]
MSATTLTTAPPRSVTSWLRRVLAFDAAGTVLNGIAYAVASGPIGRFLGIDPGLMLGLGIGLIAYGAAVGALAAGGNPPALGVRTVIEANLAWTVLSFIALFAWLEPSTAGAVWVPAQAVVVGALAGLQHVALRSTRVNS